jgi:hypothetical protein
MYIYTQIILVSEILIATNFVIIKIHLLFINSIFLSKHKHTHSSLMSFLLIKGIKFKEKKYFFFLIQIIKLLIT